MKSVTLNSLGKTEEMNIFCQQWMEQEPDNIVAASALVYAKLAQKDLVAAEEIVERFIKEDISCNEENDILFTAAEKVYQMNGNKKKQKQIQSAMKEYEEYLENYYNGTDFDEDDLEEEWDLPFC